MAAVDPYAEVEGDDHIKISEKEGSEFMEFPKEENNTVLLSTIQAQFPDAIGLKYKGSSGAWRAIRAVDNVLEGPKGSWGRRIYCLTLSGEIIFFIKYIKFIQFVKSKLFSF